MDMAFWLYYPKFHANFMLFFPDVKFWKIPKNSQLKIPRNLPERFNPFATLCTMEVSVSKQLTQHLRVEHIGEALSILVQIEAVP